MAKTITAYGNAQISTAQSKFGGASGLFDGAGDYLTTPDSDDWDFPFSTNATIDMWVRMNSLSTHQAFVNHYNIDVGWIFRFNYTQGLEFFTQDNGGTPSSILSEGSVSGWSMETLYHIAFVQDSNNNWYLFKDGLQVATKTNTLAISQSSGVLSIGTGQSLGSEPLNGYMDELRISKGIARWTSNFTPPTSAYTADSYTKLLLHMDGTNGSTTFTDDDIIPSGGGAYYYYQNLKRINSLLRR